LATFWSLLWLTDWSAVTSGIVAQAIFTPPNLVLSENFFLMACAVATSCCISDVPSQCEGRNFDPPQLPHFSADLNQTWNQERYLGYDPTRKIWLMWDDGKGVCVGRAFSVTFCVLSFFCIFAVATSCCISKVPSQWEGRNFDPHSSHIFQPILIKLEIKKDIQDTTPQAKFGWRGTTGRGSS